jgi:hypothetical protein
MQLNYPWLREADMTKNYRHLLIGIIWLALGFALASVPNRYEGPSLLHLAEGHGLSVSDVVALVPLLWGTVLVIQGVWPARTELWGQVRTWLQVGGVEIFLAGMAVGVIVNRLVFDFRWGRMSIWLIIAATLGWRLWSVQRRG